MEKHKPNHHLITSRRLNRYSLEGTGHNRLSGGPWSTGTDKDRGGVGNEVGNNVRCAHDNKTPSGTNKEMRRESESHRVEFKSHFKS